jgi:hypothetical protein
MSFYDDLYYHSEARKTMEARKKVNFVSFGEKAINEGKQWCPVCNVVLIYKDNGATAWCKECGQSTPTNQLRTQKTLRSKFGENRDAGPMIVSKERRSTKKVPLTDSVNSELSEEDKIELRSMGFNI